MESLNLLLKNVTLYHRGHALHGKTTDILITNGKIEKIAPGLAAASHQTVEQPGLCVSAGWIDLQARFGDPGFEHRETITTGLDAAARGGFTRVVMMPGTQPVISGKSQVEYALKNAAGNAVRLMVAGSLSHKMEGKDLSEMFDMQQSGAVMITDDKAELNSGLLSRALQYAIGIPVTLSTYPCDNGFFGHGQVNEGHASMFTGLKAIPAIAEEAGLARDLYLVRYNNNRLHFSPLSAAGSVALLKQAHEDGLPVSGAVSWMSLCFTEEEMLQFDSNYKVYPPLRSAADRDALVEAVQDGVLSAVVSDHTPLEIEAKDLEFDDATFGVRGLEGLFGALTTYCTGLSTEALVHALTQGPADVLQQGIDPAEGATAELTLFNPTLEWTFAPHDVPYGYANTPLMGKRLTGKALGIIGNGQFRWFGS